VVIDMRKKRIRIHKQTLHMLGDPKFIQLLVNPTSQAIAIRCSTSKDYNAHRVQWQLLSDNQCCEIYSKYLVETISAAVMYLDKMNTYRIPGKLCSKEKLAYFNLKDASCVNSTEGANI